ncbi:hypothetical protein RUM44_012632 [Polyplax serrata]|uniref:C2HC/C3H-type domain-containing protein n=1 Tax=Polyplax serrata TaxID=468196 RepID=A0ABR1BFM4_POLSC
MGSQTLITSEGYKLEFEEPKDVDQKLVDCKNCGRHFAANRIETHELICQNQKKRKPFDITLQRIRGTDAEKYLSKNKNRAKLEKPSPSAPKNWRKQHEDFINSMKAARQVSAHLKKGGNIRDLPPPPPSDYSDYIQCPHCSRKFNSTAAERHIPKCADMQHNKPKPAVQKNAVKPSRK